MFEKNIFATGILTPNGTCTCTCSCGCDPVGEAGGQANAASSVARASSKSSPA